MVELILQRVLGNISQFNLFPSKSKRFNLVKLQSEAGIAHILFRLLSLKSRYSIDAIFQIIGGMVSSAFLDKFKFVTSVNLHRDSGISFILLSHK
jgi:hypothetical protein